MFAVGGLWELLDGDPKGWFVFAVFGLSSMVGQATLAFGPTLLGLARDATGSYDAAIGLCIALQLVGAVLVLAGPRRGAVNQLNA